MRPMITPSRQPLPVEIPQTVQGQPCGLCPTRPRQSHHGCCYDVGRVNPDLRWTERETLTVFTPEFWGRVWQDATYVYAGVADGPIPGWIHYEATIGGRYFGALDGNGKITSIGIRPREMLL